MYALGIEPVDCALRNVLWERKTERWYACALVPRNHVTLVLM